MKVRLLALLVLIAASGCLTPEAKLAASENRLLKRVTQYHEALTWRDYDQAAALVAPARRMDFLSHAQKLQRGYTLDSYSVRDLQLDADGRSAKAILHRTFILAPSVILQTEDIVQPWALVKDEWFLSGPPF
jgi:hypothetical protein